MAGNTETSVIIYVQTHTWDSLGQRLTEVCPQWGCLLVVSCYHSCSTDMAVASSSIGSHSSNRKKKKKGKRKKTGHAQFGDYLASVPYRSSPKASKDERKQSNENPVQRSVLIRALIECFNLTWIKSENGGKCLWLCYKTACVCMRSTLQLVDMAVNRRCDYSCGN